MQLVFFDTYMSAYLPTQEFDGATDEPPPAQTDRSVVHLDEVTKLVGDEVVVLGRGEFMSCSHVKSCVIGL